LAPAGAIGNKNFSNWARKEAKVEMPKITETKIEIPKIITDTETNKIVPPAEKIQEKPQEIKKSFIELQEELFEKYIENEDKFLENM